VSQVQRINLRHTDRQYLHRDLQKINSLTGGRLSGLFSRFGMGSGHSPLISSRSKC
jgi:hypothetical protein